MTLFFLRPPPSLIPSEVGLPPFPFLLSKSQSVQGCPQKKERRRGRFFQEEEEEEERFTIDCQSVLVLASIGLFLFQKKKELPKSPVKLTPTHPQHTHTKRGPFFRVGFSPSSLTKIDRRNSIIWGVFFGVGVGVGGVVGVGNVGGCLFAAPNSSWEILGGGVVTKGDRLITLSNFLPQTLGGCGGDARTSRIG